MLNIAKQIYYGWNSKTVKDPLPEAEIVPDGTTTNEKKRLASITTKYTNIQEHENIPLPGFTLFKTNRKNYGSADQSWLIIDPRGFLARISNENLENILHVTGITEGLIQEKCVWAREDSQTKLTLIPVSSESYIEAVRNTTLLEEKVKMKDVQIGDTVLLQNELTGVYMGTASLYGPIRQRGLTHKAQIYPRRQIIKVAKGKYHYQADLKILKVTDKTDSPMSREDAVELMNEDIRTGIAFFNNTTDMSRGYYTSRDMIKYVSTYAAVSVPIKLLEITVDEAEEVFSEANGISDPGMLALVDSSGQHHLISFPYSMSSKSLTVDSFTTEKVKYTEQKSDQFEEVKATGHTSYYNRPPKELHALDKFAKFYKIVKHVKNGSYV